MAKRKPDLMSQLNELDKDAQEGEVSTTDLLKRIDELGAKLKSLEGAGDSYQGIARRKPQARDLKAPGKIDLTKMPDRDIDPEGYDAELSRRIENHTQAQIKYAAEISKPQVDDRPEGLWETYKEEFPQFSEHQDRVEFAAQKVLQGAEKRGLDIDDYMYNHTDRFFKAVNKTMESTFGKGEKEDKPQKKDEDEGFYSSRAMGLFGGQEGGGKPTGNEDDDEGGASLTEQLRKEQRASGYF